MWNGISYSQNYYYIPNPTPTPQFHDLTVNPKSITIVSLCTDIKRVSTVSRHTVLKQPSASTFRQKQTENFSATAFEWSLTLRDKRRLMVFDKRVLRRIFGSKRDEVTREWRKLHDEELNDLYSSFSIVRMIKSRRMRGAGHVAHEGQERCIQGLGGETGGKETIWKTQT
jgi:hypothetical protein